MLMKWHSLFLLQEHKFLCTTFSYTENVRTLHWPLFTQTTDFLMSDSLIISSCWHLVNYAWAEEQIVQLWKQLSPVSTYIPTSIFILFLGYCYTLSKKYIWLTAAGHQWPSRKMLYFSNYKFISVPPNNSFWFMIVWKEEKVIRVRPRQPSGFWD